MKKAYFFSVAILMAGLFWFLQDNQIALWGLSLVTVAATLNMGFHGYLIRRGRPFAEWLAGNDGVAMVWASLIWASAAANLSNTLLGVALFSSAVFLFWQATNNSGNAIAD